MNIANPAAALSFDDMILSQGREISRKLNLLRHENFPPDARKNMLRQFSMAEAAYFLGVSPAISRNYIWKVKVSSRPF